MKTTATVDDCDFEPLHRFNAIHNRHDNVDDNQVRTEATRGVKQRLFVEHVFYDLQVGFHYPANQRMHIFVVVGNNDGRPSCFGLHLPDYPLT